MFSPAAIAVAILGCLAAPDGAGAEWVLLHDGRRFEVERYRIDAESVILEAGHQSTSVPLAAVDFEATFRANAEGAEAGEPVKVFRDPERPFEFRIRSWNADPTAGDFGTVMVEAELVNLDPQRYQEVQVEVVTVDSGQRAIDKATTVVGPLEPGGRTEFQVRLRYFGGEADVLAHVIKAKR